MLQSDEGIVLGKLIRRQHLENNEFRKAGQSRYLIEHETRTAVLCCVVLCCVVCIAHMMLKETEDIGNGRRKPVSWSVKEGRQEDGG